MYGTDTVTGYAWPSGAATGVGSLPGTDVVEALRVVFGELPELPYLPELPERGPGAETVGRSLALLVDLPVEVYAGQWRFALRPGLDLRRSNDLRERDLDRLLEQAEGYTGPLKVQAAGPWTLAAATDLPLGGRVLRDPGAVRDLTGSLAEGLAAHVAEVSARVPGASVLLQLDEPTLPAVLAGGVPTESGLHRYPPVATSTAREVLRTVIDRVPVPVLVHCCAPEVPVALLRDVGAVAVSLDLSLLDIDAPGAVDPLAEALDAGFGLFAGVVPTSADDLAPETGARRRADADGTGRADPAAAAAADRLRELWRRIGFAPETLPRQVVVTPACGLAGASPEYARHAMSACRETARRLADDPAPRPRD